MNRDFFANPHEEEEYNSSKLDEFNQSHFSTIYRQYLEGGLFHSTTLEGLRGIVMSKHILPNRGQNNFTFPQSEGSFANTQSYISLFDFRNSQDEEIIHHYWKFNTFFCKGNDIKIILGISHENLVEDIILNTANPPRGHPNHKPFIPVFEVWYPGEIPVSAISQVIVSCLSAGELSSYEFQTVDEAEAFLKS